MGCRGAKSVARFTEKLMDHFQSPRNAVDLEDPDVVGRAGAPDSPPFMILKLRVDDVVVRAVSFQTFGCGVSIACGSALSELVRGRSLDDCRRIDGDAVVRALDDVPEDKRWCADLSVSALRDALSQLEERVP